MKSALAENTAADRVALIKPDPSLPAFEIIGGELLALRAGVAIVVAGRTTNFPDGLTLALPAGVLPGTDLVITEEAPGLPMVHIATSLADCAHPSVIGGVHFAPGGAATGRAGGDEVSSLDPHSLWDIAFRPACPDPRGMVRVAGSRGGPTVAPFWIDKYLLAQDHLEGTSRLGVAIADGRNKPQLLDGAGHFGDCNYHTVTKVLGHHGKQVPSHDEFFAAAFGVTEKTAAEDRAETTVLDAPRTSFCGVVQATGQRWVWGHDGDPDAPRASLFGGSWGYGGFAGSRCADVGSWPGSSYDWISARGRSDHLQLV